MNITEAEKALWYLLECLSHYHMCSSEATRQWCKEQLEAALDDFYTLGGDDGWLTYRVEAQLGVALAKGWQE